ncbi:alanine racemase [bacterium]|nr:alanine racemase [bacterium]
MSDLPGSFSEFSYTPKLAGIDDIGSSLITLEVFLDRFRSNLRILTDWLAPAGIILVVKANAYGFGVEGLLPIISEFEQIMLGVATPDEALELRALGFGGRILLMGYTHPRCYYQIKHSDCELSAYRPENIPLIAEAWSDIGRPLKLHVKLDTGMTRLGVQFSELRGFLELIARYDNISVAGLFTHLVSSERPELAVNRSQAAQFAEAVALCEDFLGYRPMCHVANSEGTVNLPQLHYDSVRLGQLAYGIRMSDAGIAPEGLQQCFRLTSEVVDIHRIGAGQGVSYTHSFVSSKPTTVVTFPYGYADGMWRQLGNLAQVLIGGRRCRVVGNVTMDYMMADVGEMDVQLGEPVTIIGETGGLRICIEDVARMLDTVPYEICCRWGRRVRRVYSGD